MLTEAAALVGPSLLTAPVCPGCLAPARAPLLPCSECALPVCSPACAQSREHRLECKLLKENKGRQQHLGNLTNFCYALNSHNLSPEIPITC